MKAIVYTEYGAPEVLHLAEAPHPTPQENEILIRVRAASVSFGDLLARNFGNISAGEFNMPAPLYFLARVAFGWSKPRQPILGSGFAGEVAAVGDAVTRFKPGDAVFGYRGQQMGTYAEYLVMREDGFVTHKPANLGDAEAAVAPYGGLTALTLLRRVNLRPGQRVLINGASGGIGAALVQLAKQRRAHVTGVCGTLRLAYVQALGADEVIDYTKEDFARRGETYDLIVDVLGRSSFDRCRRALTPDGVYFLVSFKMKAVMQMLWTKAAGRQKVICAFSDEKPADLELLREMIEAGSFTSIVDRSFAMEHAVEVHRYAESGHKQGPIVISFQRK